MTAAPLVQKTANRRLLRREKSSLPGSARAVCDGKKIGEAEQELHAKRAALEDPAVTSDRIRLQDACTELEAAQKAVDDLYAPGASSKKN